MSRTKAGEGVPGSYKQDASKKTDVLFKVKIKGRSYLTEGIPLHMSLRVFDNLTKEHMETVKDKVKEFGVQAPNSEKLTFKTTIFHSRHTKRDYYMLKIYGVDKNLEEFFNFFKNGYGFSHDKFMSHITIDKALYDQINKEGLKPSEIDFCPLSIEDGADNTVHEFKKSEGQMTENKGMQITPEEISDVEDIGTLNQTPVKMLRTKGGYFIAIGRPRGKMREEALAAGSHPAIVKYNLERQFQEYQPNMMKSENASEEPIVNKHSHHLSEDLIKSGYDIFSIESPSQIEFQITKQNATVHSVVANLKDDTLVFNKMVADPKFAHALAGATSEKALEKGSKKIKFERN